MPSALAVAEEAGVTLAETLAGELVLRRTCFSASDFAWLRGLATDELVALVAEYADAPRRSAKPKTRLN